MIGYVTLGTNDLQGNAPFYDAIAKEMGVGRMMDTDSYIAWGEPGGAAGVALAKIGCLATLATAKSSGLKGRIPDESIVDRKVAPA